MKTKYIKLPNDDIVAVDERGYITNTVEVEIGAIVGKDLDRFMDLLSDMATGTFDLTNLRYEVIGHRGNTLRLAVTGCVEGMEVEEVDVEALPERAFQVEVTRVGYGQRTISLSAKTLDQAIDIADDDAGNHLYSEHHSEYRIEATPA